MPRGDKSRYTDKQERKADHIAEGDQKRAFPRKRPSAEPGRPSTRTMAAARNREGRAAARITGHPAAHKCGRKGGSGFRVALGRAAIGICEEGALPRASAMRSTPHMTQTRSVTDCDSWASAFSCRYPYARKMPPARLWYAPRAPRLCVRRKCPALCGTPAGADRPPLQRSAGSWPPGIPLLMASSDVRAHRGRQSANAAAQTDDRPCQRFVR